MSCACGSGSSTSTLEAGEGPSSVDDQAASGDANADVDDDGFGEALAALDGNGAHQDDFAWDDESVVADAESLDAESLDDDALDDDALDDDDELEEDDETPKESEFDDELEELELEAMDDEALDALPPAHRERRQGVRVFQLFRKQAFDFTFLLAGLATEVVLRRALKVPPGYYFWLGLRVHNRDIATGNFNLSAFETLPSSEDPAEFTSSGTVLSISVTAAAGDAPPALKVDTATGLGPRLEITLVAKQGSVAPFRLYAELSAVLFARPA
jgi:hypothetical protein